MMKNNCLLFCKAKSAFQHRKSSSFLRNLCSGTSVDNSQVKECSSLIYDQYERSPPPILENPKGLKDYGANQVRKKNLIVQKIVNRFKSHGAECLDTPLFELRHILAGKYGRGCKPICLKDEGGILSMRYDLTVPFARHLAMNKIKCFKRYQVGKVYRLKCPNIIGNQMKEFTQCDFDIAGLYNPMLSDVECVHLLKEVFKDLNFGNHVIKVNHRQILYGILDICGVPGEKINSVYSSIHKFGKVSWEELRKEMINMHILNQEVVDRISGFITKKGGRELVDDLLRMEKLAQNNLARQGLEEMKLFFSYCEWLDINEVCFDLSLVGAFDYYTGIIFKGVLKEKAGGNDMEPNIWVAGGGRYDNLVGMFDSKNNSIPCVGVSFMVENIFSVSENEHEVWNHDTMARNLRGTASESILDEHSAEESQEFDVDESVRPVTVPKGTKDFKPVQMKIREEIFKKIIMCFEKHGFEPIDTPLFEIKDYLCGNQEESDKLIFDVETEGGIPLSMRYDLTVPFARYIAMYDVKHMKRYQIGHVGRRDSPSMVTGRHRTFYQCDIDIAGDYGPMVADVECMYVLMEVLNNIQIGEYVIKVNHRKILDGILEVCGVPAEKTHSVISSIDKLDKLSWDEVRTEMIHERHLDSSIVDHIGKYIQKKGGRQLVEELFESELLQNESLKEGLQDMQLFFRYCDKSDLSKKVTWDLSLARGLDYYTGIIFEAVSTGLVDSEGERINVGSIAGGGRYDNLIGMFNSENRSISCVGMSLGIERISIILEAKHKASGEKMRTNETEVLVTTPQKKHAEQRTRMCLKLWKSGIKTELQYKLSPKLLDQLQYCEDRGIPWAVVFGQSELDAGTVKLRNVETREELEIPEQHLIEEIKKRCNLETS